MTRASALALVVGMFLPLVSGCAGGKSPIQTGNSVTRGSARFTIRWPQSTTRLIPEAATSIKIQLTGPTPQTRVVTRPAGTISSEVIFSDLVVGDYTATASAHPDSTALGVAQATGTIPVAIIKNQTTNASLTMDSTITRVEIGISGDRLIDIGQTRTLNATARNSANDVVLVAPAKWQWSIDNTTAFTLTPSGSSATLRANQAGTTVVTLLDLESGKSATLECIGRGFTFLGLGMVADSTETSASGVTPDGGTIVGVATLPGKKPRAFRWSLLGGYTLLPFLPGSNQVVHLASAGATDGSKIVGIDSTAIDPFYSRAVMWDANNNIQALGYPPGQGENSSKQEVHGVSNDGTAIAGTIGQAFRWTAATGFTLLGSLDTHPNYRFSEGFAISANGSVVVGRSSFSNGYESQAFRWTASTGMVGLGFISGGKKKSIARATSADGSVIVGYDEDSDSFPMAFRWTQTEGMLKIGRVSGLVDSIASGVSGDGQIVVGYGSYISQFDGFIWTKSRGIQSLRQYIINKGVDMTRWPNLIAVAISMDGKTIVGTGDYLPVGAISTRREAFMLYNPESFLN